MLMVIILLLIVIIAILLLGPAAIIAAIGIAVAYLVVTLVAFFLAVPVAELVGWDAIFGIALFAMIAFMIWGFWDEADRRERAEAERRPANRQNFVSAPPSAARRKEILNEIRRNAKRERSGQIDVAPDNPPNDRPILGLKKDGSVGRISRKRLKP